MPKYTKKRTSKWSDLDNFKPTIVKGPGSEGKIADGISLKSLRDLPKSSITLKSDPYTNSNNPSTPYAILAPDNRKVGGSYRGLANLDAGNVQQYAASNVSKFVDAFDFMSLKINLNYRYLPTRKSSGPGRELVNQMRKAMAEATSLLGATTFTSLSINDYVIETDLEMGDATTDEVAGKQVYTKLPDVLYAYSTYYQMVLQKVNMMFCWHNSFRLKQGNCIRSSWNRETPNLNSLFGLFNKKSFLNLLESTALSFMGEYFDNSFAQDSAIIYALPSRKNNSMLSPTLEIIPNLKMPEYFRAYIRTINGATSTLTNIFDSDNLSAMLTACDNMMDKLSSVAVMKWARRQATSQTAKEYINECTNFIETINSGLTVFKTSVNDLREAFDIMSRTGTVAWNKGYYPSVIQDTDAQLVDSLIIDDIYKMVLAGAADITYDQNTYRWTSFSFWNMYTGIPEYDAFQGGAFLSFSCKDIQNVTGSLNYGYIPIGFTVPSYTVETVSRGGTIATVGVTEVTFNDSAVLSRLAPLPSQGQLVTRVPVVRSADNLSTPEKSFLANALTQLTGFANIEGATATDVNCDPDIIAIYQYQIEDFTNVATKYARSHAPFRPASDVGTDDIIGFSYSAGKA